MIEKIKLSIDNLVKHGEIKKGESIKVKNLSRDKLILLDACFVGNLHYSTKKQTFIDARNPQNIVYALEVMYLGEK